MKKKVAILSLCIAICALKVMGDTVQMNDGTSFQGRVIDQGEKYWIKDSNGESHTVDKSAVKSWTKDSDTGASTPTAATNTPVAPVPAGSGSFAATKAKANLSETAIAAVGLWQAFIDNKPSPADLAAAKIELKHWQEVMDGSGEKINGKWIWGDEHEKLIKQVEKLLVEGDEAFKNNQTLVGISKMEEVVKLYPNDFDANFELGYVDLVKGLESHSNAKVDSAIKSLETAVAVQPKSAAALSDLAIGYCFKKKYELSVQTAYKAAKIEDSKGIVQNLINSIAWAPVGLQNNSKVKPIIGEAAILAGKYGIAMGATEWVWVRPDPEVTTAKRSTSPEEGDDEKEGPPGPFGEGTGFFISSNGYILTNKHVAKPGDYLMVRLADNSLRMADRVVIDDEQDMAVIKIKVNEEVPFVRLAGYDHPAVGADVAVFGFPLLGQTFGFKSTVKMTRGIVTAWDKDNELCDVTVDAIVNPGNSGGPMVDHHGNLLALTAMKTIANNGMVTTYGLGYSTQRVRRFLEKQKDKLVPAKLETGKDDGAVLSNEDLATRLTPSTVLILMCRGTAPTLGSDGKYHAADKK